MIDKLVILGNGNDWCTFSLNGFLNNPRISIINDRFPVKNKIMKKIGQCFFSVRLNRKINVPFKKVWYISILKRIENEINGYEKACVLIYDRNILGGQQSFVTQIRRKFPHCKLAYIFTNIVKYSGAEERSCVDKLNDWYDVVFAFDPEDARKYNFEYSTLIYDASVEVEPSNQQDKVFYVGQAKDRLEGLLACFEKLKSISIPCDFHIANVPENKIKYPDEIVYNKMISYSDCIAHIKSASCLIDIIQGDSSGLTIKTCEAVCYDKKLITTNKHVKEYPFYDERYIRIIETPDDIDTAFFTENQCVRYSQEGKQVFSADSFLKKLESLIEKRDVSWHV